ncbi:MAG: hypothetical protein IT372_38110 [Polyangiaceae bacterium]|nr:hypothetical protein [Polyangiaceae bacterium]
MEPDDVLALILLAKVFRFRAIFVVCSENPMWPRLQSPLERIEEIIMPWYVYFAYFFGGAFFANALPHLIAGVSGQPLQSPFASPPLKGLSSPAVNVAWALVNLALAYQSQ